MGRLRSFDERDVVAMARDAFWQYGYGGTSVELLTASTGLARGSLYAAFGDKHALFVRALQSYCDAAIRRLVDDLRGEQTSSAYSGLVRHVRNMARANISDRTRRGCLMAKSAAELVPADTEVTAQIKQVYDTYRSELTQAVHRAQADGDIDPGASADGIAALILLTLRGMEATRKLGASKTDISAAADQLIASISRR
jgi:TetR/AcrR family transcriptional regulator, transcriptional repressor for nem operon